MGYFVSSTLNGEKLLCELVSTGPAAEPSGRFSPLRLAGGEDGDPPLCIGKQEVETYIYSLLYTYTGLLG
jgi:hypothetical protein